MNAFHVSGVVVLRENQRIAALRPTWMFGMPKEQNLFPAKWILP